MEKGSKGQDYYPHQRSELAKVMAQDPRCHADAGRVDPFLNPQLFLPAHNDHLLIVPKKLPNPVLESRNHMNMQRELKLNNKLGTSVLNQRSELDKVFLEKKRSDFHKDTEPKKTDFEIMIEKRRKEQEAREAQEADEKSQGELKQIHRKIFPSGAGS